MYLNDTFVKVRCGEQGFCESGLNSVQRVS